MTEENNSEYKPQYRAIKMWREDERPRERLLAHGSATLSDAELIAILLGNGSVGFSAVDAARALLTQYDNLTNLSALDLSRFKTVKGIGNAKAVTLSAAFEIARRVQAEPFSSKKSIKSPEDIARMFIPKLMGLKKEIFRVLLLNTAHQIIREVVVSEGSLSASIVHPREVFQLAISESAAGIILMHNHPSGNPEPSVEDKSITRQLVEAGKLLDIPIIDHLIIAGDSFTSFAKMGLL